ncbi:MAG: glycosyltransferase family 2 protein [Sediminicola sp.]|tara:strand:- start:21687 stop:22691 length:1005 start_codon:yes stop_codon:yes gene_type:complete
MTAPLVSIPIPFKNTAAYLKECIQSIRDQQYHTWEILAVDDHSTDGSRAIMENFADLDDRIKVVTNPGNGIIDALNTAYSMSSGTYITRMDSDDIMAPHRLQQMVGSLQLSGMGHIALGLVKYFREGAVGNGYRSYEGWLNGLTKTGANFGEIYKECVIPSPCWMVHRKDLDRAGAFVPDRYPEDYDLAFRFYAAGLKCIPTQEILHFWRDHGARASRNSDHYRENSFLDLKIHHFLNLHKMDRPLVLWGAGKKGKKLAQLLIREKTDFYWACNNDKKIGREVYGKNLRHFKDLGDVDHPQYIVAVAGTIAQDSIREYLQSRNLKNMEDYFFFC